MSSPLSQAKTKLHEYLERQEKGVGLCLQRYNLEFQAYADLGGLFDKLVQAWRPPGRPLTDQEGFRWVFLTSVKEQMYGTVFLLLRLRAADAEAITRYAIEATALAHHLWKNPGLFKTYQDACPHIAEERKSNQFELSSSYKNELGEKKLFASLEKTLPERGKHLRTGYALICYHASHAGPGIKHRLKERNGKIEYRAHSVDQESADTDWAILLTYYFDMLHVFYAIMKETITDQTRTRLEHDFRDWHSRVMPQLSREALDRKAKGPGQQ